MTLCCVALVRRRGSTVACRNASSADSRKGPAGQRVQHFVLRYRMRMCRVWRGAEIESGRTTLIYAVGPAVDSRRSFFVMDARSQHGTSCSHIPRFAPASPGTHLPPPTATSTRHARLQRTSDPASRTSHPPLPALARAHHGSTSLPCPPTSLAASVPFVLRMAARVRKCPRFRFPICVDFPINPTLLVDTKARQETPPSG